MESEPHWKSMTETWGRLKDAARQNRRAPTIAEALLWQALRGGRLAGLRFRRQHAIGPYLVDFYCAAAHLVVEVDGPIHDRQREQDAVRTQFLEAMGLRVTRFTNEQVTANPRQILTTIESLVASAPLRRHGEGPGVRSHHAP